MLDNFFNSLARSSNLSLLSYSLRVVHWSLSGSKSPQVSRTLLSILVDLNNAVVWMVSARPLISKSSNLSTKLLVTVPSAPITIGITVTFMLHSCFNSQARSRYLSFFSLSFSFTCSQPERQSSLFVRFSLLLFTPWEIFTSASVDGLSLEIEWKQVSSSLQDSSQYSSSSQ